MKRVFRDDVVDRALREQTAILEDEIKKRLPHSESMFLIGSLARGEGGMVKLKGAACPVNDYDLYVVTDESITEGEIFALQKRCEERIRQSVRRNYGRGKLWNELDRIVESFKVDIRIKKKGVMESLPMLRFYEMKKTSLYFYGKDVSGAMPDVDVKDMKPADGLKLLFNECTHLLEAAREGALRGGASPSEKFMVRYFISKLYCSMGTALLILDKSMKPTMKERAARLAEIYGRSFPELKERVPDLPQKVGTYAKVRMESDISSVNGNITGMFFQAQEDAECVFRYFLRVMLGGAGGGWDEMHGPIDRDLWKAYYGPYLSHHTKKKTGITPPGPLVDLMSFFTKAYLNRRYLKNTRTGVYKKTGRKRPADIGIDIMYVMFLTFFSIKKSGADAVLLGLAAKRLGMDSEQPAWEEVRNAYVELYRSYYWQKII